MVRPLEHVRQLHPLVLGLLEFLPDLPDTDDGAPAWPLGDYETWLHAADTCLRLLYCLPMPAPAVEATVAASRIARSDATELTYLRLLADEIRRLPRSALAPSSLADAERRAHDRLAAALEADVAFPARLEDLAARARSTVDRAPAGTVDPPAPTRRPPTPPTAEAAPAPRVGRPAADDPDFDQRGRARRRPLAWSEDDARLELTCPLADTCPRDADWRANPQGLLVHLSTVHGLRGHKVEVVENRLQLVRAAIDLAKGAAMPSAEQLAAVTAAGDELADRPAATAPGSDAPGAPGALDAEPGPDPAPVPLEPSGDPVKLGPTVAVNRETAEHLASLDPTRQHQAAEVLGELADALTDQVEPGPPDPGTSSPPPATLERARHLAALPAQGDPQPVGDPVGDPDGPPVIRCDLDDERNPGESCAYTADDPDELDRHLRRRHRLYSGLDPDDQEFRAEKVRERLATAGLAAGWDPPYTRMTGTG